MNNLFWGMQFRTCRIFWDFADHQSSLNPKKSYKYKSHTAITSIVVALATNLKIKCKSLQKFLLRFAFAKSRILLYLVIARFGYAESWQSTIKIKSARSANPCPTPSLLKATKSPKYPLKSFCYFLLSQKVESPLPSNFNLSNKADFTNPTQQTIEGIAVEVAEFLPNFECETRLGVCEHSKFGKSMQDAPKRELQKEIAYDS